MTAEGAIAEVRATHIGPKKELHNPKSEAPKKTESKWKRLIQNLKKEDSLNQPRHVLEVLTEIGISEKYSLVKSEIQAQIKKAQGVMPDVFDKSFGIDIFVGKIRDQRQLEMKQENQILQTPESIRKILTALQPDSVDDISTTKFLGDSILLTSANGVEIQLTLPTEQKMLRDPLTNHLGLQINAQKMKGVSTETNAIVSKLAAEQNNADSLLQTTQGIVDYVSMVKEVLPAEISREKQKMDSIKDKEKQRADWLIDESIIENNPIKSRLPAEYAKTPEELRERMKTLKYLPAEAEMRQAFKGREKEFDQFCFENEVYELYTQEFVDSISRYLISRAALYQNNIDSTNLRPIRIVEVGAGRGQMTHFIKEKMQELGIRNDQLEIRATDPNIWSEDLGKTVIDVENLDAEKAVQKYQPDIVLFSWIPPGEDLSPALRQNSVQEYVLVGEELSGNDRTWGKNVIFDKDVMADYEKDGFYKQYLGEGDDDSLNLVHGQLGRGQIKEGIDDSQHSTTIAFIRE